MSNLSIRDANVCHALEGAALKSGACEEGVVEAQAIFLRWKDRGWERAERCALAWLLMRPTLCWQVDAAGDILREQQGIPPATGDVIAFMRERLQRTYFPQKAGAI